MAAIPFSLFLALTVVSYSLAYDCYRSTDKASRPLDLSEHSSPRSPSPPPSLRRTKRDTSAASTALQFDSNNYLYISDLSEQILNDEFTLSLWIYLEGGQPTGGTILGLKNRCFGYSPWSFTLWPASTAIGQKSKLTFSIEDVYRQKKTISVPDYKHHTWFHLAVVNNVRHLRLFVNGVKIATGEGMAWKEFTDTDCIQLEVGHKSAGFRGKVKDLNISSDSLSARKIKQLHAGIAKPTSSIWLHESLSNLKPHWSTKSPPTPVRELVNQKTAQTITAPSCGKTVCDNPAVITSYTANPELRQSKTVSLEILVMADNDGSHQSIPTDQLSRATDFISRAFRPSNISWQFETRIIKNTTLRRSSILLDCRPAMIGDEHCDSCTSGDCCDFKAINYDAGDCRNRYNKYENDLCTRSMLNNGHCDQACNIFYYRYDYGDCCLSRNKLCIDPNSVNRTYYHISEVRSSIRTSDDKLSLVVLDWMRDGILGIASLPWERNADTMFGSVIVDTSVLDHPHSLATAVHELGHILGLWHVHHGISEIICTDACLEREPSLVLGDLCSDTSPTMKHTKCSDPDVGEKDVCFIAQALKNTPYNNYMSYANGTCSSHKSFTPQQTARMHCYLDLVHNEAVKEKRPSAVPLPPQVLYADTGSVTLSWLPPFSAGHARSVCRRCDSAHSFTQYASSASMTGADRYNIEIRERYGAEHATDAPDSASCKLTLKVWSPANYYFKLHTCSGGSCQFNFTFLHSVKPQTMRLWMPWFKSISGDSPVTSIQLVSPDGLVVKEITAVHIQCDKPFTRTFQSMERLVNKVIINSRTPDVAFDAVELTSAPNMDICKGCNSLKYKVEREPPLNLNVNAIVSETLFEDKTVVSGEEYSYTITAMNGIVPGAPSKRFQYTHNQEFCGNGRLDGTEKCDDGNLADGDGCSTACQIENGYVCLGTPSICWLDIEVESRHCSFKFTHEEDGCGYYVPPNFTDQWASTVTTIGRSLTCSSDHMLLGPPPPGLKCQSTLTELSPPLWLPCQLMASKTSTDFYQLKFGFEKPVVVTALVIHIGTDGGLSQKTISASQIFDGETTQNDIGNVWNVNCKKSPLILPVYRELAQLFKYTKEVILTVNSRAISIAAVRVRTFEHFDPVTVNSCGSSLYNSETNQCTEPAVTKSCDPLVISHSNITCTGTTGGDKCTAFCDLGYATSTVSGTTTCIDGRWAPALTCQIIKCPKPVVELGYTTCADGHHFNSVCEISCNQQSQLRGNGTFMKCLESGTWTKPRASCSPICPDLATQHAVVTDDSCSGEQEMGARCRITCQPGYYIDGYDKKTRKAKPVCTRHGEWNLRCVRVECAPIPAVWSGLYSCTDGLKSGTVCTATCPTTKVKTAKTCSTLGRWNVSFPVCDVPNVQCPSTVSSSSEVKLNCTGRSIGSVCRASCRSSSLILLGQTKSSNGQVSFSRFRDKLHCTSLGKWTPSVQSLQCGTACDEERIGDGWCDADNNRQVCQWDGGDCCVSTSKVQSVQKYPETCGSECSCKDPEAEENDSANVANRRNNRPHGYVLDTRPDAGR